MSGATVDHPTVWKYLTLTALLVGTAGVCALWAAVLAVWAMTTAVPAAPAGLIPLIVAVGFLAIGLFVGTCGVTGLALLASTNAHNITVLSLWSNQLYDSFNNANSMFSSQPVRDCDL